MPRSGGPSTATGVGYQALAVARRLVDVHLDRIVSVRPEAPPMSSFGGTLIPVSVDDFVVSEGVRRHYYQAKSSDGTWTVGRLCSSSVLPAFIKQARADAAATCYLLTPGTCLLLGEVADRARSSKSLAEFRANLTAPLLAEFEEYYQHKDLVLPEAEAYELLKRFKLEQKTLDGLYEDIHTISAATFNEPTGAVDGLFLMAEVWMRTGTEVSKELLASEFAKRGVYNKPAAAPAQLSSLLEAASARIHDGPIDIEGVHIVQPAVASILSWAGSPAAAEKPLAAFLDQAGSGKSVAMSVLCKRLRLRGFDVLGIRLDGLGFKTPEELQRALSLPAPIPAVVQALKAAEKRVVVLIDQLDALALGFAHQPETASTIMDLAARLAHIGGVPVIVACRSFDWEYSHILAEIKNKTALKETLPELTVEQVKAVLPAFGLRPDQLHPETIQVIRSPYRLRLLIDIVKEHRRTDANWLPPQDSTSSLQALLEEYWKLKLHRAEEEGGLSAECVVAVQKVAQYLGDNETLSAPSAILDVHTKAGAWLQSNGLLVSTAGGVSFFHQTFFDFVFARQFVVANPSLSTYLKGTDQSLFYRALTRQVLAYIRTTDAKRYLKEVRDILDDAGIREHIKWLVVASVGQSAAPTTDELALLTPHYVAEDKLWRTMQFWKKNAGWFDLVGVAAFKGWLENPKTLRAAMFYLESIIPSRPEAVAELLTTYVGRDENWNAHVSSALVSLGDNWGPAAVGLLKAILSDANTNLDREHGWWWMAFHDLAKHRPAEACELIPVILERYDSRWPRNTDTKVKEPDSLLPKVHEFSEALKMFAAKCPQRLLDLAVPWLTVRMEATCTAESPHLYKSEYSVWRIEQDVAGEPTTSLLAAVRTAAGEISAKTPASLSSLVPVFAATELAPLHCILARIYSTNPAAFAADAASYLVVDARRLRLGTTSNHLRLSAQLIEACSPFWSDAQVQSVEKAILALLPLTKPRYTEDLKWQGTEYLQLLSALPPEKMSSLGRRKLGEMQRKFPKLNTSDLDDDFMGGVVGPPIPQERLAKLDDAGWIGAMKEYKDEERPDRGIFSLRGGRHELAEALRDFTEKNSARGLSLAAKMDATLHPDYARALIRGLAKAKIPVLQLWNIIKKFLPVMPEDALHWISSALAEYPFEDIPAEAVAKIKEWALHSKSPTPEEEAKPETHGGQKRRELLHQGLNNNRGGALYSLGAILLHAKPPRVSEFLDVAEEVAQDHAASVRAICLNFMAYSIAVEPMRGHAIYAKLVAGHPELLRELGTQQCIYRALHRNPEKVLADIETLLSDADAEVRESAATLACLAAFETPKAHPMRDACLAGAPELRKGAATVYAANLSDSRVGEECRTRLTAYFDDDDSTVRHKSVGFLSKLKPETLVSLEGVVTLWAASKAVDEGADNIAHSLNKHPVANPALTLAVTEKILDALGREVVNIQTRHGMIAYLLVPALLNVYRHTTDTAIRKKALDLFERFEALGTDQISKAYDSYDRS